MNPRIIERFLLLFFLIATAFIAADMVNTAGKGKMQILPSFKAPERIIRKTVDVAQTAVSESQEPVQPAQEPIPPLRLIGTITGARPYAIFLDPTTNKQELYKLKEDIGNGWILSSIEKNKATFKKNGRTETMEVKFIENEPAKPETGSVAKPASSGVRLDPREVEGALSDLNKVMTQARVVPNIVDGKTVGYRIFNIVPDSIYTKIGIMNSDIIERVNGVEIKSPDTLYQLFQQIKSESRITLDLTRAGKKESIKIEIR